MGHAGTVAQKVYGLVEIGLRQLSQFGFGFSIYQQYFSVANSGIVDAEIVVLVLAVRKTLQLVVAREVLVEILYVYTLSWSITHGALQFPSGVGESLRHAWVAVLEFVDKLLGLIAGLC